MKSIGLIDKAKFEVTFLFKMQRMLGFFLGSDWCEVFDILHLLQKFTPPLKVVLQH